MAGERGDVLAESLARPQPARARRGQIGAPAASWPMNVTRPSAVTSRVCGLATSWNRAPKRSAWPRVSSLASGSSSTARSAPACSPNTALGVALERDRLGQHGTGVLVDVEVVVAALLDAPQRRELRQHDLGDPEPVHQPQPVDRALGADHSFSSANTRSAATPRSPATVARRQRRRSRRRGRARAGTRSGPSAGRAADRRRTRRSETIRSRRAARSPIPPNGSIGSPPCERLGDRVDREVARARGRPRSIPPISGIRSTCQPPVAGDDAPAAEALRERERMPAGGPRERRRGPGRDRRRATTSKSVVARPSSRSRRAPPTSHAVAARSRRRAASGSLTAPAPVAVVVARVTRAEIPHAIS